MIGDFHREPNENRPQDHAKEVQQLADPCWSLRPARLTVPILVFDARVHVLEDLLVASYRQPWDRHDREPAGPTWSSNLFVVQPFHEDDHSAFSAYHHDLEKVSETLKDGKSVFSGTGMPDTSNRAWLAIKIKAETPKGESTTEEQSVEPNQRQKNSPLNLCRRMSTICSSQSVFPWTKRRHNKSAAIPIQKQPSM